MFDVVAADDDEFAASIDGRGVDDSQTRLTASRGLKPCRAKAANRPGQDADEEKDDYKCDRERHSGR